VWLAVLGVTGLVTATAGVASAEVTPTVGAAAVLNVRTDCGATGNGTTNDTPAINRCIASANSGGGGTVQFPSGRYLAGSSIHMMSNVTIQLDSGSTILGAGSGYDPPESNPNDSFQDYGHSHFHNAMIWGNNLTNIGFTGSGTIDGNNHLITGNPSSGQADKIISLTRCDGLTLNGITLRQGGHFAILINGCNHVTSDHLNIQTASDRDGWNIINTQNVTITNITDAGNDDALVFKSDWALGQKFFNGHVTVTDAHLSAGCCNALMFGSETCGDFSDYNFDRITITGASKSGLGMVSMDGTTISDVHYRNITMSGVASPIMEKIGTRRRCGNSPGIGSIHDITYDNVTGTGKGPFSPTIWGAGPSNQIHNITFNNVNLTVPGGSGTTGTGVPSNDPNNYNPNSIGTRPAYGWYIHYADHITFNNSSVQFNNNDGRPAVIANIGSALLFDHFTVERGTSSPADFIFQSINGYCVRNSTTSAGGAPRITATGSTESCPAPGDDFSLAATPSTQTVTPGATATYTVATTVAAGAPGDVTLSAAGLPTGATATFSPNPVPAGSSSTLSITTDPATPNGTSAITVTGTAGTATHTATTSLTVDAGGGGGLTIGGLTVADTANAANWSVQSNLHIGSVQYGDRAFTLTAVPAALVGAQWIRTANGSKGSTANPLVGFTVSRSVTVSLAIDTRIGKRSWMDASWVDSGTSLRNNEGTARTFEVFTKTFPAGQVSLGPNGSSGSSNYVIVVS
jgi:polygalacturonase